MQATSLGDIFVENGLITREQLNDALEKQRTLKAHKMLGDLLVQLGYITERDRVKALGEQWGVSYVDLTDYPFEPELLKRVSQELARRFKVIPLEKRDGKLLLAMKNPLDIFAIDEIRLITGLEVEPMIATEEEILNAIGSALRFRAERLRPRRRCDQGPR